MGKLSARERERRQRQSLRDKSSPPGRHGFRIAEFCRRNAVGRSFVYGEIAAGRLKARKAGRVTLIFPEDEDEWRANLPRLVLGHQAYA